MSIKCTLGLHTWVDCTCTQCGKVRHEHHVFTDDCEKCSKCGTIIENNHNWSHNCEKCSKCGKTRDNGHDWTKDCEKCSNCGTHRKDHHKLLDGICQVCGIGNYTDTKEGIVYKIIKIGDHVIMGENFAAIPESGNFWAYDNNKNNVAKNGYLYDWDTAKKLAPKGWHVPSKAEWESVFNFLGGKEKLVNSQLKSGGASGFEGMYSGWRYARGIFNSLAASGHFWSSTEANENEVWHFKMSAVKGAAEIEKVDKEYGLSVRYFRN